MTGFRAMISPTAGGFALWFFALIAHAYSMAGCGGPGGRGDYSGYSGRGQSPTEADKRLGLLMMVAVYARNLVKWIRIYRLLVHDRA